MLSLFDLLFIFSVISFGLNFSSFSFRNFFIFTFGPSLIPKYKKSPSVKSGKTSPDISSFIKLFFAFSGILNAFDQESYFPPSVCFV